MRAVAQASVWLALLRSCERTPATDQGVQLWLSESELHRNAFEHVTAVWARYVDSIA